jgi:hypothetical protein
MSIEQRRQYCQKKISEHTPPETPHDEFMIKVYKGLLDLHDDADENPVGILGTHRQAQ